MQTRVLSRAEIEAAIRYWMAHTQVPCGYRQLGECKFPVFGSGGEPQATIVVKDPDVDPGKGI